MNLPRKKLLFVLFVLLSTINSVFAQNSPPTPNEDKKKFKVQLLSDGKVIPPNRTLTKSDTNIQLKFFAFDGKLSKELVPSDITLNVLRHGKLIANQLLKSTSSIANLALLAQNEDTYLFEVKEIFEKNTDGSLTSYAKGTAKFSYLFFDANFIK